MKRRVSLISVMLSSSMLLFSQASPPKESYASLHARAEAGDATAENQLGVRFRTGDGVDKDLLTALGWYRLAALRGLPEAYFNLGASYYNGDGVPVDEIAACKWFLLAAEAGDASGKSAYAREQQERESRNGTVCMVLAGDAYQQGKEIPKDEQHALQMYREAAAGGNTTANVRLFFAYRDGLGVPKDMSAATQWLQQAGDHRDGYALFLLGRVYETGDGVPADLHRACEEYKKGVALFSWDAVHALGLLLRDGHGVKQDPVKAYLFLRGSSGRNPNAKAELEDIASHFSKKDWQKVNDVYRQRIDAKSVTCQ